MTWIIKDWMSNHCYPEMKFDSFEEARDFISEVASNEATKQATTKTEEEFEEIYNGICEDLYAIEVDEDGNSINIRME